VDATGTVAEITDRVFAMLPVTAVTSVGG
jgi:hypothetical protein